MSRFPAWHYDGSSAVRRDVLIDPRGRRFALIEDEQELGEYAFADLEFVDDQGRWLTYRLTDGDGWRLGVPNPPASELNEHLPGKVAYGGFIDRIGLGRAALMLAGVSAVVAGVVLTAPRWIAPLIPASAERQLGEAMFGDFGGRVCSTPEGEAALAKLVDKLDGRRDDLRVEVVNIGMVNAVALPGNRVVLFDGLLDEAERPEEATAVLGHEFGHVRERHVMQSLLRQMGLSVLLGGMDGTGGTTISGLLSLSYSRDAEREADAYSIQAMQRGNISPEGGADFFERLQDEEPQARGRMQTVFGYLSSHPHSEDREEEFREAVRERDYPPALTDAEWTALQDMCENDEDVAEDMDEIQIVVPQDDPAANEGTDAAP